MPCTVGQFEFNIESKKFSIEYQNRFLEENACAQCKGVLGGSKAVLSGYWVFLVIWNTFLCIFESFLLGSMYML